MMSPHKVSKVKTRVKSMCQVFRNHLLRIMKQDEFNTDRKITLTLKAKKYTATRGKVSIRKMMTLTLSFYLQLNPFKP